MQIIQPNYEIITPKTSADGIAMIKMMEQAARTCYKSEDKITDDSATKFVTMLRERKHHAMLEFGTIIVKFVTDRGVSHELVRHRLCSFAQESTRYCDYGGKGIQVVLPCEIIEGTPEYNHWQKAMNFAQLQYEELRELKCSPQIARAVLPTCLKTEIVLQANTREWRHIFTMRTPITAHPDMRKLMIPLLAEMKTLVPIVFDDL